MVHNNDGSLSSKSNLVFFLLVKLLILILQKNNILLLVYQLYQLTYVSFFVLKDEKGFALPNKLRRKKNCEWLIIIYNKNINNI